MTLLTESRVLYQLSMIRRLDVPAPYCGLVGCIGHAAIIRTVPAHFAYLTPEDCFHLGVSEVLCYIICLAEIRMRVQ